MTAKEWLATFTDGFNYGFTTGIEIRITKKFPKDKKYPISKSIIIYKYSDYVRKNESNKRKQDW